MQPSYKVFHVVNLKHQHFRTQMNRYGLFHRRLDIIFNDRLRMEQFHGKRATGNVERWHVAIKVGELLRVHRGRGDNELHIQEKSKYT